jgi:hypothetical protein
MSARGEGGIWSAEVCCTGAGNEGAGCGRVRAVELAEVFNSCTYARPVATVECPQCGAWTDLPGTLWPGNLDQLRPLVRRRFPAAPKL